MLMLHAPTTMANEFSQKDHGKRKTTAKTTANVHVFLDKSVGATLKWPVLKLATLRAPNHTSHVAAPYLGSLHAAVCVPVG